MTQTSLDIPQNPSNPSPRPPYDSADLIEQLQSKLLALGRDIDTLPAADIEKTAKAISTLIVGVEKADAYLQTCGEFSQGGALSEPSRLDLLRKIKRMVDNGVLDELAVNADV
jgi:hypothetical protein